MSESLPEARVPPTPSLGSIRPRCTETLQVTAIPFWVILGDEADSIRSRSTSFEEVAQDQMSSK